MDKKSKGVSLRKRQSKVNTLREIECASVERSNHSSLGRMRKGSYLTSVLSEFQTLGLDPLVREK